MGLTVLLGSAIACLANSPPDIALRVTGEGRSPERTTVRKVMTPEPIHIAVDKSLHELTALMYTHRVRRIAAVDGDHQVVGVVTLDDVLALLGEEMSDMARTVLESFLHKPLAADPWTHGKGRHPPYRLLLTLLAARLSPGPLARPRELP
jgi:Mg/Co/Ni transporter MgtE